MVVRLSGWDRGKWTTPMARRSGSIDCYRWKQISPPPPPSTPSSTCNFQTQAAVTATTAAARNGRPQPTQRAQSTERRAQSTRRSTATTTTQPLQPNRSSTLAPPGYDHTPPTHHPHTTGLVPYCLVPLAIPSQRVWSRPYFRAHTM